MSKSNNVITVTRDARDLRIYINNHLHLQILLKDYVGVQSWLEGSKKCMYFIEFYTKTTDILLEYDDRDLWIEILKLINENI